MNKKDRRPIQLSLTLVLLLVAVIASLFAVWRLRQKLPVEGNWNAYLIERGMTQNDVAKIMGERHSGDDSRWGYRYYRDDINREWITVDIFFENGRVIDVPRRGHEPFPDEQSQ
jgi:hypothetical protein